MDDRDAILTRRALLVASALAGLRCSSSLNGAEDVAAVQRPPGANNANPSATASVSAVSSSPVSPMNWVPWAEIMTQRPPLDPPRSPLVSKREVEALQELSDRWKPRYVDLGEAWDGFPAGCRVAACPGQWRSVRLAAAVAMNIEDELCPDLSQPRSALQRQQAHRTFFRERALELAKAISTRAQELGERQALDAVAPPRVIAAACLSCVVEKVHVGTEVTFARERSNLDDAARTAIDAIVATFDRDKQMVVHVRGHADPTETGDRLALSKARIEAVRTALVAKGIAAKQLVPEPLADTVPITTSRTEGDSRRNRRVELERAD